MKKIFKRITIRKVAAVGVLGITYTAAFCFGNFVCRCKLPIPVKVIISGIGGTAIGATGGEAAKRLWEYDNSEEITGGLIESIEEISRQVELITP